MDKQSVTAIALFTIVLVLVQSVLFMYYKSSFQVNKQTYEQAGVMEYTIDGQKLYIPVFRRK